MPESPLTSLPPPERPAPPVFTGRGPAINPPNRFERLQVAFDADAFQPERDGAPDERPDPRTQFFHDATESLLTRNDSPDIPFSWGLNVYRGCEHGCAYCYARPYHEYLGWSSGLDFETKILVKLRAPALLRRELSSPNWLPELISMSGATDCYQPAERHFRLTRQCLEVFAELRHPVGLITKSHLVTRDCDLLNELARWNCVSVFVTITTLDSDLARKLEPRAARPEHRLHAIRQLAAAGVPVGVMTAPIIPGLTEHEIPAILDAAAAAGARRAGYVVLRLPWEVKEVFSTWLDLHAPSKKARVLDRVRALRGGALNVSEWGARMKGEGLFAEQIHDLFAVAARRAGLNHDRSRREISTAHFRRPGGTQLSLF
jgi:DNA repair photolyase